jgi:hypothetical protein
MVKKTFDKINCSTHQNIYLSNLIGQINWLIDHVIDSNYGNDDGFCEIKIVYLCYQVIIMDNKMIIETSTNIHTNPGWTTFLALTYSIMKIFSKFQKQMMI